MPRVPICPVDRHHDHINIVGLCCNVILYQFSLILPILTHQFSPTNSHPPILTHQLSPTNSHPPTLTYQFSPTNSHLPILTHQFSPTNSHPPTLTHQFSSTNSHLPILTYQSSPGSDKNKFRGALLFILGVIVLLVLDNDAGLNQHAETVGESHVQHAVYMVFDQLGKSCS